MSLGDGEMTREMTAMSGVEVEVEGAIATVRFDRGGKANALDHAMIDALETAARALSLNPDVSVIVLAGIVGYVYIINRTRNLRKWVTGGT